MCPFIDFYIFIITFVNLQSSSWYCPAITQNKSSEADYDKGKAFLLHACASVYCTYNTCISNAHWIRRFFWCKGKRKTCLCFSKQTSCQNHSSRAFSKHTTNSTYKGHRFCEQCAQKNIKHLCVLHTTTAWSTWEHVAQKLQLNEFSKMANLIPAIIQSVRS